MPSFPGARFACACFCEHLRQTPHDLTLHPNLALAPLRRRSAPRDTRAPRAPSIFASPCWLPWLASVVGSVEPDGCPLFREAARALHATMRADAQNDNTRATTPNVYEVPTSSVRRGTDIVNESASK